MPDVKVPLLGNVPKGSVIAGGFAAVGVGLYVWYRHGQKKAVQGEYGYGSGTYGYGSPYGYGQGAYGYGYYGYGFGNVTPYPSGSEYGYGAYGYGYYNPYTGQYLGAGAPGTGVAPSPAPAPLPSSPATNMQWLSKAVNALGGNKTSARTALIKYLGGLPLTSSQVETVREAIGLEGYPPKSGTGGYPPKWRSSGPAHRRPHHKRVDRINAA